MTTVSRCKNNLYVYETAQLCEDNRKQFTLTFHDSGLLVSDYVRVILSNFCSNRPSRTDTITLNEFHEALRDHIDDL